MCVDISASVDKIGHFLVSSNQNSQQLQFISKLPRNWQK